MTHTPRTQPFAKLSLLCRRAALAVSLLAASPAAIAVPGPGAPPPTPAPASHWLGQTNSTWSGENWAGVYTGPNGTTINATINTPNTNSRITLSAPGAQNQTPITLDVDASIISLTVNSTAGLSGNKTLTSSVGNINEGILTLGGGITANFTSITIADAPSSTATLTLNGSDTRLISSSTIVGNEGNGTLNILSGANATTNIARVGNVFGSTGTVLVDGAGSTWSVTSQLTVDGGGIGYVTISNGGELSSGSAVLAELADVLGTVTVTGNGSKWTNNGTLEVGQAGPGILNIQDSGIVSVGANGTGTVKLGSNSGSNGTLNIGAPGGNSTAGTLNAAEVNGGLGTAAVNFNQSDSITFAPRITGNASVNQLGVGTTTLTANNTHTGGTAISAGTLQLGSGGTSGSILGNVTVSGGGNLAFNRSDTFTFGGNVTGSGSVLQNGNGTTVLTGRSNYSGGTAINAGTLEVSGTGNVSGGSLFMRNGVYRVIGNGTASHNNLFVSDTAGTTSIVNVNTGGNLTASGPMFIGHTGTGTVNVSGNASRVTGNSTTFLGGPVAGGNGTLNVTDNARFSTSSNLFVGNSGRGLLNITLGGNVTSGIISVGITSGTEGIITLDAGRLSGTSITVGQSGTGNLTALNGSTVNATGGSTFIGSSGFGTARFNASTFNAGQLYVANSANGALTIENGSTLKTASSNAFIAAGSGTTGVLTVSGNGSTWLHTGQLFIGNNGNGTLNVLNGGVVTSGGGNAFVGAGSNSRGVLLVDGAGSSYTINGTGDFSLGGRNSSVTVSNGGFLETKGRAFIAAGGGTSATATVTGAGSRWRSLDYFSVGQDGSASLTVADGGVVQAGTGGNGTIYIGDRTTPGQLNIGAGARAGLIEASTITGGFAGTNPATVSFFHIDTDYFFTNTGDAIGTGVAIIGNTQVSFVGSGTTVLTRANTYTGGSAIANGTVRTTNAAALGTGHVSMKGGTLDPVGRLDINSLTWGGGTIASELGTATDLLAVSGNLTLSDGGNFTFTAGSGFALNTRYTILSAANLSDSMLALFGGNSLLGSAPTFLRDGLNLLVSFIANSGGGGTTIQNTAPISTPDDANFIVTGAARTGSPTQNNIINSLTFNPETSLLIFNILQITGGNVTVPTGNATITGGLLNAPGGFNKNGSGLLSILANLLANGPSFVNGGGLFINGIFQANGGLTVLQNALLGGNGTIFGDVLNFGTVNSGNSPGTLTIAGNFTQASSGTLALEIASPTVFDRLVVSGTANLAGTLAVQNLGTSLAYGQQYAFLEAGSISGAFDQISMPQSNLYRGRFLINGGTGTLLVAPTSYTLVAETQNQRNVAKALDSFIPATSGDRLVVSTALDLQSAEQYPAAFDAISPAQYENLASTSIEQSNALSQILQQRFSSVRLTGARGFTQQGLKSPIVSDSGKSYVGKNVREGKDILTPAPDNNWGAWVQGDGFFGDFTSLATVPNSRFTSGGVTAGLDYRFPVGVTVGLFSGYSGLYSKYANGGTMNINTVNFGLYAAYEHDGGFYANLIVAGGYSGYQVKRSVEFSTIDRAAKSDPSGGLFSTTLDLGYDWEVGGFTITPTIAGQFTYVGIAPFTESGADSLDLRVDDQAATSLRTSLGARVAYPIKISESIAFIPQVSLLWQHEFLQNSRNIAAALDGGAGPGFDYATSTPSRDAAYAGAGFTLRVGESLSFNANYNVNFGREDFFSNMVSGGLNISF